MNNLAKYRAKKGITQEQIGQKLGLTKAAISFSEHNKLSVELAKSCSEILEVNVFEILGTDAFRLLPTTEEDKKALIKIIKDL